MRNIFKHLGELSNSTEYPETQLNNNEECKSDTESVVSAENVGSEEDGSISDEQCRNIEDENLKISNILVETTTRIFSRMDSLESKIRELAAPLTEMLTKVQGEISEDSNLIKDLHDEMYIKLGNQESKLEEKQERLEIINQRIQEDRYRKDKATLLNKCIYFIELIRKTLDDYPTYKSSIEDIESYFFQQLGNIATGIESTLLTEGVQRRSFSSVGGKVVPEYQETVGVIDTDDPTKDNTIAKVVSPAYVWTLPYILRGKINEAGDEIKCYKFLMRAEQIVVYKYIVTPNENNL